LQRCRVRVDVTGVRIIAILDIDGAQLQIQLRKLGLYSQQAEGGLVDGKLSRGDIRGRGFLLNWL
jgi:hypothetical protein